MVRPERALCFFSWIPLACSAGSSAESSFQDEASGGAAAALGSGGAAGRVEMGAGRASTGAGGIDSVGSTGAGGSASAVAGASGGLPPVATSPPEGYPYDTSVVFDWPEAEPMAGQCLPGTYSGEFECDLSAGLGLAIISGPAQFVLTPTPSGEFLEIEGGRLDYTVANLGIPFPSTAGISGRLDCATNELLGEIVNGVGVGIVPFFGEIEGHLDRLSETITGTWYLRDGVDPNVPPAAHCTGTWSVARAP